MGQSLGRGLADLPGRGRDLKLGYRLQLAWARIVGELMTKYLFPVDVSGAKLTIGVTNAVWMQEAEYLRDTLLANISKELGPGAVRELAFRMLPQAPAAPARHRPAAPLTPVPPPPPLSADERAHLDAELARISDPALREQMRRILEKSLARHRDT